MHETERTGHAPRTGRDASRDNKPQYQGGNSPSIHPDAPGFTLAQVRGGGHA